MKAEVLNRGARVATKQNYLFHLNLLRSGIYVLSFLLIAAIPAVADEVSGSGSFSFDEADGPYFTGYWSIPGGQSYGIHGYNTGVDLGYLPAGSIIQSATFNFSVSGLLGGILVPVTTTNVSLGGLGCSSGGGSWLAPFPPGNTVSFTPCPVSEDQYYLPSFSGTDGLSGDIPGINLIAEGSYTVTIDFSTVPEPGSYGFLVGLGIFAVLLGKSRRRFRASC